MLSFNKHLLSTCYVPGTVLDTGNMVMCKTEAISALLESRFQWRREANKNDVRHEWSKQPRERSGHSENPGWRHVSDDSSEAES